MFTNPSPAELKYLTPFEIGESKIHLYGAPSIMNLKSKLIESLLDKLSPDTNTLAPKMKINPNSLMYLWTKLNGSDSELPTDSLDIIEIWPLLNYFDVDVKDSLVYGYINHILIDQISTLIKHQDLLQDVLKKIKIIDPKLYDTYQKKIKTHEMGGLPLIIKYNDAKFNTIIVDPNNLDANIKEKLKGIAYSLMDGTVNGYGIYVPAIRGFQLFSIPEWNGSEYVMYPIDTRTGKRVHMNI